MHIPMECFHLFTDEQVDCFHVVFANSCSYVSMIGHTFLFTQEHVGCLCVLAS